jgi:GNAT superfamily N-acetyltransferase
MCDEWMPALQLPLTPEQFHQLPRHPAYRYEFLNGQAFLSPNARHYHAELDLTQPAPDPGDLRDDVALRRLEADDWPALVPLFAAAFHGTQPYAGLDDSRRLEAAQRSLERTRTGGDGPLIELACFVAEQREPEVCLGHRRPPLIGAICITLLPEGDPCEWDSYYWTSPPPPDCVALRLGRPHLTWIFVAPLQAGRGVGTALLTAAVHELQAMRFPKLATTFMAGNESSMLWHWRNGFRLLAYPGSRRRFGQRRKPSANSLRHDGQDG